MVSPDRQNGAGLADAAHFGVKGVKVEPVNGSANRYEIHAARGDGGAFSRFHAVGNPVVRECVLDLAGTGIGGDNPDEVPGQLDGSLAVARAAVPGETTEYQPMPNGVYSYAA